VVAETLNGTFKSTIISVIEKENPVTYQILTTTAASITDLKKNPMGTVAEAEGGAVAILNRNEPAFYCVPPELYAYYRELAEDAELNRIADERLQDAEFVSVHLGDL
jgi:antitoxin StbD